MPRVKGDGGSVFPTEKDVISYAKSGLGNVVGKELIGGLTLRDYFAAKAMQSILLDSRYSDNPSRVADYSYQQADEMLKASEVQDAKE